MRDFRVLTGLLLAGLLWAAPLPAGAQAFDCSLDAALPCALQLEDLRVQKAPRSFRFQARVSQAKLPLGNGELDVTVQIMRGDQVLCTEDFADVLVRASVINLEVGQTLSCPLDEVLAENRESLGLRLCLGGGCLSTVALPSSMYALKATYAARAMTAVRAVTATRANYGQRATADGALVGRGRIGAGFFDFYSGGHADTQPLYPTAAEYAPYVDSGFLAWAPARDVAAKRVHIALWDHDLQSANWLEQIVLAAKHTRAVGGLHVQANAILSAALTAKADASLAAVSTRGPAELHGPTTVKGHARLLHSDLTSSHPLTLGDGDDTTTVNGTLEGTGQVTVHGASTLGDQANDTITVRGSLQVAGDLVATAGAQVAQLAGVTATGPLRVSASLLTITGHARMRSGLSLATATGPALVFDAHPGGGGRIQYGGTELAVIDTAGDLVGGTLNAEIPAHAPDLPGMHALTVDGVDIVTSEADFDLNGEGSSAAEWIGRGGFWRASGHAPCSFGMGQAEWTGEIDVSLGIDPSDAAYHDEPMNNPQLWKIPSGQTHVSATIRGPTIVAAVQVTGLELGWGFTFTPSWGPGAPASGESYQRYSKINVRAWRASAGNAVPETECTIEWTLERSWGL